MQKPFKHAGVAVGVEYVSFYPVLGQARLGEALLFSFDPFMYLLSVGHLHPLGGSPP